MSEERKRRPTGDDVDGLRAALAENRRIFTTADKHSVTIAGHATSIRIESLYWKSLLAESHRFGVPVNALVAEIDAARLTVDDPPNLASAIRLWLFSRHAVAPDDGEAAD